MFAGRVGVSGRRESRRNFGAVATERERSLPSTMPVRYSGQIKEKIWKGRCR